jgi:transcriptional regulator with XRE-family HTH domain
MSSFSELIKRGRQAKGWTQLDLAQALRVTQQTVANWEAGSIPKGNRIAALSQALDIELIGPVPVYQAVHQCLICKTTNLATGEFFCAICDKAYVEARK